jgi:hypothetical protein
VARLPAVARLTGAEQLALLRREVVDLPEQLLLEVETIGRISSGCNLRPKKLNWSQSYDRELQRQRCKFLQRQHCKFLQRHG